MTPTLFAEMPYTLPDGSHGSFDTNQARAIYNALVRKEYVDDAGALTAAYHDAKRNGTLDFGPMKELKEGIVAALDQVRDKESLEAGVATDYQSLYDLVTK